jgi:hypothetical protein
MAWLSRDGSKLENRLVVLIRRPGTAPRTAGTGNSLTFFAKKNAKCFVYWNKFAIFAVTIDSKQTIILK